MQASRKIRFGAIRRTLKLTITAITLVLLTLPAVWGQGQKVSDASRRLNLIRNRINDTQAMLSVANWTWALRTVTPGGKKSLPEAVRVERHFDDLVIWRERQVPPPNQGQPSMPVTSLPRILAELYGPGYYGYIFENARGGPDHVEIYPDAKPESGSGSESRPVPIDAMVMGLFNPLKLVASMGQFKRENGQTIWETKTQTRVVRSYFRDDGALTKTTVKTPNSLEVAKTLSYRELAHLIIPETVMISSGPSSLGTFVQLTNYRSGIGNLSVPQGLDVVDHRRLPGRSSGSYGSRQVYRYKWSGSVPIVEDLPRVELGQKPKFTVDWSMVGIFALFAVLVAGALVSVKRARTPLAK